MQIIYIYIHLCNLFTYTYICIYIFLFRYASIIYIYIHIHMCKLSLYIYIYTCNIHYDILWYIYTCLYSCCFASEIYIYIYTCMVLYYFYIWTCAYIYIPVCSQFHTRTSIYVYWTSTFLQALCRVAGLTKSKPFVMREGQDDPNKPQVQPVTNSWQGLFKIVQRYSKHHGTWIRKECHLSPRVSLC